MRTITFVTNVITKLHNVAIFLNILTLLVPNPKSYSAVSATFRKIVTAD